jgi:hypothetical protein
VKHITRNLIEAREKNCRIHAGQRDEFGQEFFRARHGCKMSQPKVLCHYLLDMGFLRA